jgi:hypothetical protein
MSLEFPAVTNARANGDGGLDIKAFVTTSVLASMVGIGWSKDNLRTADRCYVAARFPNGSVEYPCDSSNHNQFVNGHFTSQLQQTMLAALSLGPVGISDQLSSYPTNASAAITSNRTLVMATCTADGVLLQPSYPLTPVEEQLTASDALDEGSNVWGTYTAVAVGASGMGSGDAATAPAAPTDATGVWYTFIGWFAGTRTVPTPPPSYTLRQRQLDAMIDASSPHALKSLRSFADVPRVPFLGAGGEGDSKDAASVVDRVVYLWWASHIVEDAAEAEAEAAEAGAGSTTCGYVEPVAFTGELTVDLPVQLSRPPKGFPVQPTLQLNLAPVLGAGLVSLLGEAGKVTAVSTYRFSSIVESAGRIDVALRGAPNETVHLRFAHKNKNGNWTCVAKAASIGPGGAGTASFVAPAGGNCGAGCGSGRGGTPGERVFAILHAKCEPDRRIAHRARTLHGGWQKQKPKTKADPSTARAGSAAAPSPRFLGRWMKPQPLIVSSSVDQVVGAPQEEKGP